MCNINRYFTMGLREKVALTLAVVTLIQITCVSCSPKEKTHEKYSSKRNQKRNLDTTTQSPVVITLRPYVQGAKSRNKQPSDTNHEIIRKKFNFPDVEYPTASTPRPPFHLQETNILQRNPVQRSPDSPSSTTTQYSLNSSRKGMKYSNLKHSKFKSAQNPGITFPEFGTTPKPYCFREEGAFPEVEYPLSARDTWKPNYWKQITHGGSKNEINDNGPNSIPQVASNVMSSDQPLSKVSMKATINSAAAQKPVLSKNTNSNYFMTTPAPIQGSSTTSTTPFILTPYTTLYFDTTQSSIDTRTDGKENTTPMIKKPKRKKKFKKKPSKKDPPATPSTPAGIMTPKDENYINSTISLSVTTPLPHEVFHVTNSQESFFTKLPNDPMSEGNIDKLDTCPNIADDTLPYMYVVTTTPSYYLSSNDVTPVSSIHNDDEMPTVPCNNSNASISDAINTIVSENRDNEDLCFEDNVRNSNKSSTCEDNINISSLSPREDVNVLPTADEEFTTDVFPDFDENMLFVPKISTSTLSPINIITVDEDWTNSGVIDPYKLMSYSDELEQYYIAVP